MIRLLPGQATYIDSESLATYGTAQSAAPALILRRLRKPRRTLVPDLRADITVFGLGAVILPIAIYK